MLLEEQVHSNFYRPYYRGIIKSYDRTKADFPKMYYLTTSFAYAAFYAKTDGIVEEYRLKNKINIFNAKSSKDYNALRLFLLKSPTLNKYTTKLDRLKDEDWTFVLGFGGRDELVDALTDLGYDGYFNFEFTKHLKLDLEKRQEPIPVVGDEPAIGIINPDMFSKVEIHEGKLDFLKFEDYRKFIDKELIDIKDKAFMFYQKAKLSEDSIKVIFANSTYSTLTKSEINNFLDSLDYKEMLKESVNYTKFLKEWLDDRHLELLGIK